MNDADGAAMKVIQFVLLLSASTLLSTAEEEGAGSDSAVEAAPALFLQFNGTEDEPSWRAVNDGVMGGLSKGGPKVKEGRLVFTGELSLKNNGGFSSVRTDDGPWDIDGAKGMHLRVKGDGRTYSLRLSTNALHRGDRIAYQAKFPTVRGEWKEVWVPFSSLSPSHHGNQLNGPPINLSEVTEMGFILADGKAGDFAFEVDWMKTYSPANEPGE